MVELGTVGFSELVEGRGWGTRKKKRVLGGNAVWCAAYRFETSLVYIEHFFEAPFLCFTVIPTLKPHILFIHVIIYQPSDKA